MLRFQILISFLLLTCAVWAQSIPKMEKIANEYFEANRYVESAEFYKKLADLVPENRSYQYLEARSYFEQLQYETALPILERLALSPGDYQMEAIYYIGFINKLSGEFKAADSVFLKLLGQEAVDPEFISLASFQKRGCELALRQGGKVRGYTIKEVPTLNSPAHDFGVSIHQQLLTIASTRSGSQKQLSDHQYGGYLSNVFSYRRSASEWEITEELKDINNKWAQGSGSFTADGQVFYFSSCESGYCEIFSVKKQNGSWGNPSRLPQEVNLPGFNSRHPAISSSGDTLFFTSNRPEGIGGDDIWMTFKVADGLWVPAINMGQSINTSADEITPFYRQETLFFASNGHAGYGGFDLFLTAGVSFFEPYIYNLGLPFNSSRDDSYFFGDQKEGYISSNRDRTRLDIFSFSYTSLLKFIQDVIRKDGRIQKEYYFVDSYDLYTFRQEDQYNYELFQPIRYEDFEEEEVKDGRIYRFVEGRVAGDPKVRMQVGPHAEMLTYSENGYFEFSFLADSVYGDHPIDIARLEGNALIYDSVANLHEHHLEKLYFDLGKSELRQESIQAIEDLMKQVSRDEIELIDIKTHTDAIGNQDFNLKLSEDRGVSIMKYFHQKGIAYANMRVTAYGEEKPLVNHDTWYGRLYNRRAELIVYTKKPKLIPVPYVYLVRKDITVSDAASLLEIQPSDLLKWNGLNQSTIAEGHVIRVFDESHSIPPLKYMIGEADIDKHIIPYVVKSGERLADIAQRFGIPEELILEMNFLNGEVSAGDELIIYL